MKTKIFLIVCISELANRICKGKCQGNIIRYPFYVFINQKVHFIIIIIIYIFVPQCLKKDKIYKKNKTA